MIIEKQEIMFIEFDNKSVNKKNYPVDSIESAVNLWNAFRDKSMEGVSGIGNGLKVFKNGVHFADISYNGRVWLK